MNAKEMYLATNILTNNALLAIVKNNEITTPYVIYCLFRLTYESPRGLYLSVYTY
jgi:hypothetical protein